MAYIVLSLFLFFLTISAHILFCRRQHGSGLQAKAFLVLSAVFLSAYVIISILMRETCNVSGVWGLPFILTGAVIFILLVPSYLTFYVLTQLMSPSKRILLTIAKHGSIDYDQVVACIRDDDFIGTRLADLCTSGCVNCTDGKYNISASGKKIAAALDLMQAFLGRETGG